MSDLKQSKSLLAKLLAQEALTVQHQNIPTAYFDVKNRILGLPVWKDMNGDLYDLLCGHEVGHALYTPAEGWHDQVTDKEMGNNFKGFLNVLEDARIEKFIKRRYPGITRSFFSAYQKLWNDNFFGVEGLDLNDLLFIDRVNILTKVGSYVTVNMSFTEKEQGYVERIKNLETWDEVVALARELFEEAKEEMKQKQIRAQQDMMMQLGVDGDPDDADGQMMPFDLDNMPDMDADDFESEAEPTSITDQAFREREKDLLDENSKPYTYLTFPDIRVEEYIHDYREILAHSKFSELAESLRITALREFTTKNNKVINHLIKEFEMRRNAQQQSRAKIAKSGEIDVKKVHMYKLTDDLFRKFTIVPNGKNHGLIVIFDMSASMRHQMEGTIEQLLILAQFCRKVNIKFEMYGFSNGAEPGQSKREEHLSDRKSKRSKVNYKVGDVALEGRFQLLQFFSDSMSSLQFKQQMSNLALASHCYSWRRADNDPYKDLTHWDMPDFLDLHSTPLLETMTVTPALFRRFKERTKAEIVNIAFLTDGEPDGDLTQVYDVREGLPFTNYVDTRSVVVLTDPATRAQAQVERKTHKGQKLMLQAIRATTGANVVGFFLTHNVRNGVKNRIYDYVDRSDDVIIDGIMKTYRQDKVAVVKDLSGYTELYVVKGEDMDFEDDDIAGATASEIRRSFAKMQKNKGVNRVLLNKFIQMIA